MRAALWHWPESAKLLATPAFSCMKYGGSWADGGGKTQALLFMGVLLIQILQKTHRSGGCSLFFSNRRLLISWHLLVLCLQEGSQSYAMGELVCAAFRLFLYPFLCYISGLESAWAA